jgi:Lytic transglycolase
MVQMPSFVPRALGRRSVLAAFSALLLSGVPAFAAPDDAVVLGQEEARLEDQAIALEQKLDVERGELVAARARLDSARAGYEEALAAVQDRLVDIYKRSASDTDPVTEVVVGDGGDIAARLDAAQVVSRRDAEDLARLREAVKTIDDLEGDIARRKMALAEDAADLEVRRLALKQRIATAGAVAAANGEAPLAPPAAPFSVSLQTATSLGLPFRPAATYRANERGLPAAIVAARSLPGFFAFDPTTGKADFGVDTPGRTPVVPETPASFDATASWYGPAFEGQKTSSGETFDPRALTAAHRTLPLGTWLRVTYAGRMVVVKVNDRGPYVDGRDLDLSQGAAETLGLTGPATVHAEVVSGPSS